MKKLIAFTLCGVTALSILAGGNSVFGAQPDILTISQNVTAEDVFIGGDPATWRPDNQISLEGMKVTLKGEKGKIYLATWKEGKHAFSISYSVGASEKRISSIIKSVK